MSYRNAEDILQEADKAGMRRAFIVTALLLEMEAVRGHLKPLGSVVGRDGAVYECGVFSDSGKDWLVVVAETGPGTHAAQSVVTNANILFPNFEVQILVGIGGSRKSDAPLGSVIASSHVYMPYSAKYSGGKRSSRPRTLHVDQKLIGIAQKVRRDKFWPTRICNPDNGTLPPINTYPMDYPPVGLVAPIASVEAVLADPDSELEALIADGYGDACVVEMEGYVAVYASSQERVPCIVVRGVSDMTQDKWPEKDAERQPVAACHAAAFAFEMLSHWAQAYPANAFPAFGSAPALETTTIGQDAVPAPSADHADVSASGAIEVETSVVSKPSPDLVLNINENLPVDLEARVSGLEVLVREIVQNQDLTVTGAKAGPLRVFIADPLKALREFGIAKLRAAFAERDQPELLGMVDIVEYGNLDAIRTQLESASAELMAWPNALPDGEKIERPELAQLIERLDGSIASTTAVLGAPGAGKSALLATLAHRYVKHGWPVLAIKSDLLRADLSTEEDLQNQLALDALPSVLLPRLAKFQPVLLILDQLDALARYLDLRTARLSILLGLVRRLSRIDNVHIVLSSRTFEFDHDVRLKAVSTESLSLQLPAWSQILALLEKRGVHAAGWPEDAQEVMRSPQALATYLKLNGQQHSEAFASYQAMLEELWNERVLTGKDGSRRGKLAGNIADQMASDESLWLAYSLFDDHVEDIAALEAAGVLTTSSGSLGFKHQTLFEYALARSFAGQKGRLTEYVLERQTSLFFRSKLWAGLNYLRSVDINAYHAELEAIWSAPDLRKHLRFLLIDFLGREAQPTDREALLMEQALQMPEQRWPAYRALTGSPGWFERFSGAFIANSMSESDEAAGAMVNVLVRAWSFAEDTVSELLKNRWAPDTNHDFRSWRVLSNAPRWTDTALEIACTIAGRADISPHSINYVVETIGVKQPETALRLVCARLDRHLALAEAKAREMSEEAVSESANMKVPLDWQISRDPPIPLKRLVDHGQGWESLPALAEHAPAAFLEFLWPWFERYFRALKERTEEYQGGLGYVRGPNIVFQFEQESDGLLGPPLLTSLRIAAECLAQTDPIAWLDWVKKLQTSELEPVQRLIAHCFANSPERLAAHALAFLLEDSRRYTLGLNSSETSTSSRLVEEASNHWTEQEIIRFETAIKSFEPAAPPHLTEVRDRHSWRWYIRRIRLSLLRALPKDRLSEGTRRHVEEEERAFPGSRIDRRSTEAHFIGPMMSSSAIALASDEDVINAFCTVPDVSGWNHPRNWMVGGNIQLSREFATFSKENPARAIRLLGLLEPENGTRAAGYALDAMAEGAEPDLVLRLLHDIAVRGFDSEEFRGSASRAIVRLVDRQAVIGDDVIAILEGWLAASQPDGVTTDKVDADTDIDTGLEAANAESEDQEDRIQRSFLWDYG